MRSKSGQTYSFGMWLRRHRKAHDWTQAELASRVNCALGTIRKLETDERRPSKELAARIAAVLDIPLDEREAVLQAARSQGVLDHLAPPIAPAQNANSSRGTTMRHQLRALVSDFVGRASLVRYMCAVLSAPADDTGRGMICGVRSMGGVGKTELAYYVTHELRVAFPDGQIVLELRGSSANPLPPEQALQTVIHAFTPDANLPNDLAALERYYRSVLHNQRVLILADDALDAMQVRPLLPPAGCALLVTSRQRFNFPGMTMIDLEMLDETEAVMLLQQICPRLSAVEAQTIANKCGSLPLALRVSGGILYNDPALNVSHYIRQLTDERQRLAQLRDPDDLHLDVAASLSLSYTQLDAAAQQVFRQLGVLMADFATPLACTVVTVDAEVDVEVALHLLLRRNLVMYDAERGRWRLHDLLRDLGRQKLESVGEYEATRWRYAHAAVQLAQEIHDQYQYLADGTGVLENLARFDVERPHFDAARAWGIAHAGTLDGDQLILAATLAATRLDELRSDAERERIPKLERGLEAAQRLGQRSAEGRILLNLGRATFDLGTFRRAIEVWEQALNIFQELGDRHNEGLTLGNLGTAYARLGDPRRAIPAYEQALALFQTLGDKRHEGHALGNLGAAYAALGEVQAAVAYLQDALAYARALGDRRFEGMILHGIGEVAHRLGAPQHALSACVEALAIAREIGDHQQEGYPLITLGRIYAALGQHMCAFTIFELALTSLQNVGDRGGGAECTWHYGLLLAAQGDYDHALPLLRASVLYKEEIEHAQVAAHRALLTRLEAGEELPAALQPPMAQRLIGGESETTGDSAADR